MTNGKDGENVTGWLDSNTGDYITAPGFMSGKTHKMIAMEFFEAQTGRKLGPQDTMSDAFKLMFRKGWIRVLDDGFEIPDAACIDGLQMFLADIRVPMDTEFWIDLQYKADLFSGVLTVEDVIDAKNWAGIARKLGRQHHRRNSGWKMAYQS